MRPSTDLRSRAAAVPNSHSCVVVIDDDEGFRESLGRLLRSAGVNPRLFASINDFVGSDPPDCPTCLVLDVRLPERSGLDFQRDLAAAGVSAPDRLRHRARGHSDERASNEGGRHRVFDETAPGAGSSGCR